MRIGERAISPIRTSNFAYVKDAGLFSVQMDSTTDISTHDQCAVVVRYVQEGKARERLLRLVNVSDSSVQSLHNLLEKSLVKYSRS